MTAIKKFEIYPQRERHPDGVEGHYGRPTGQFGWRFRAANGQISAISGEGFTRREDAHRAVSDFLNAIAAIDESLSTPISFEVVDVDK